MQLGRPLPLPPLIPGPQPSQLEKIKSAKIQKYRAVGTVGAHTSPLKIPYSANGNEADARSLHALRHRFCESPVFAQ